MHRVARHFQLVSHIGVYCFVSVVPFAPLLQDSHLHRVAEQTEGFSGREIAKLAIAWQAAAYGTPDSSFNPELMDEVLQVTSVLPFFGHIERFLDPKYLMTISCGLLVEHPHAFVSVAGRTAIHKSCTAIDAST